MARRCHHSHSPYEGKTHPEVIFGTHQTRKRRIQSKQKEIEILTKRNNMALKQISQDGTRPNKKNRRNKQTRTPNQHQNPKPFLGAIHYFADFIPNLFERTDNMRQLPKKGTKWD